MSSFLLSSGGISTIICLGICLLFLISLCGPGEAPSSQPGGSCVWFTQSGFQGHGLFGCDLVTFNSSQNISGDIGDIFPIIDWNHLFGC